MFDMFRSTVGSTMDRSPSPVGWKIPHPSDAVGLGEFMLEFGGATFSGGLYRVHDERSSVAAQGLISDAFPEFSDRARVFGYDWLGRQFALDFRRLLGGQPLVLMLEPGTGEALEVAANFADFHNEEMVEFSDAVLAINFFDEWRAAHPESIPLARDACVGYKVPLFLGGEDTIMNLELSDLDVYWTIFGQLKRSFLG